MNTKTDMKLIRINARMAGLILGLAGILLCAGCTAFQQPVFCLSLHQMTSPQDYAPETLLIHSVQDMNGDDRGSVSQFPIVDSSSFGQVQLVEGNNGKWGLRLTMDKKGTNLWRQATAEHQGHKLAVLLDGFFVTVMDFPAYDTTGIIMLPPVWSEKEARQIAEHVKTNYEHFN